MVIFGNRLMGKCDRVPGYFYVATKFFHIDFIPLVPYESWVVLAEKGRKFHGVRIPLNGKTILLAWTRTIALFASVILGLIAIMQWIDARGAMADKVPVTLAAAAAVGICVFLAFHRICTKASPQRAFQIARQIRMNEAGMAQLQRLFGEAAGQGFEVLPASRAAAAIPIAAAPISVAPQHTSAAPMPASSAAGADKFPCRVCGHQFAAQHCYSEDDGQTICHACWNAAGAATA